MSNKIYLEDCRIPYTQKIPKRIDGKLVWVEEEKIQTKKLVCDSPLVEQVWMVGYTSPSEEAEAGIMLQMLFKNGNRYSVSNKQANSFNDEDIWKYAERYLDEGGVGESYKFPSK